jgi:hypothetical protein
MARLRPDPAFSLIPFLAALALACQDSNAPDPPLPLGQAVPERQHLAGLVDQTHWADGYVWANNPFAASYSPDPFYSFNRTGGAVRITKPAGTTGRYLVRFTGLSAFLGTRSTLHVTGYNADDTYCKPARAYLVNDTVGVRCFRVSTGAAVDAVFTMVVLRKATRLAFAHAHRPTATNYAPQAKGSWNPGGKIQVFRDAVGDYRLNFSGVRAALLSSSGNGGHVQVSAVGTGKHYCKVFGWGVDIVAVRCYTQAGVLADTKFNVLILAPSDHLAYAFADQPGMASHTPDPLYSSNPTGGAIQITRVGIGVYAVSWTGIETALLDGGDVQVSTYTSDNAQCKVSHWGGASAFVRCFYPNGALVDARFTVLLGS